MMIARVPPSALSHLHPGLRLADSARPVTRLQERRAAGAAARGRRAAPRHSAAPAGLGRPRRPGRADPATAQKAAGAPASHARHRAPVAPPPGQKEVDLPEPDGPAAGQHRDRHAHRAARHRERLMGVPADPVGFVNSATGVDLGFYAAGLYSLMRPPGTGWRVILFWEGSAAGWSGRGGRSCWLRWGRRPL